MMRVATDEYVLWQSFKNGDNTSFEKIYHSYFDKLYDYGLRLVDDREMVKDTIHDLFVKLWKNKSNLGNVTAVRPYLLVALRSSIFNKLEQEKRLKFTDVQEETGFEVLFSVESDYINKESNRTQAKKLIDAINQLTSRQKEVIYLRYFQEMEYEDVANIMDITVKATYKLNARALEMLRSIMGTTSITLFLLLAILKEQ